MGELWNLCISAQENYKIDKGASRNGIIAVTSSLAVLLSVSRSPAALHKRFSLRRPHIPPCLPCFPARAGKPVKGMPTQLLKEKEDEIARINADLRERAQKIQEEQERMRERQVLNPKP